MLNRFGKHLDQVAESLNAKKGIRRQQIRQAWEEAVGPLIAANSEPFKIKEDTLYVRVTDTAWSQELSLRQKEILRRLGLGKKGPKRIRCWVGSVQSLPPPPKKIPEKPDWTPFQLSADRQRWAEKIAAEVEDPDLRETVLKTLLQHERARLFKASQGMVPCLLCGHLHEPKGEICPNCEREHRQERERKIMQKLAQEPWLSLKGLRDSFPDLARQEFIHFHRRLASNFRGGVWAAFRELEEGDELPQGLRAKLLELTMLETHLTPDHLQKRHFYFALGRQLAASYLEGKKAPKPPPKE